MITDAATSTATDAAISTTTDAATSTATDAGMVWFSPSDVHMVSFQTLYSKHTACHPQRATKG